MTESKTPVAKRMKWTENNGRFTGALMRVRIPNPNRIPVMIETVARKMNTFVALTEYR